MKKLVLLLVLIGIVAGGAAFYTKFLGAATPSSFRTVPIKKGDLSITISATGTLEPEEVVDVGAQVVGPILALGPDPRSAADPAFKDKKIDYGSPVEEGTVLAQIDPAVYKANLNQAQATLLRAKSDLGQLIAHRNQAEAEFNRAQKLRSISLNNVVSPTGTKLSSASEPIKAISDSDYDLAKANFEVAKSNVDVGDATVAQAQAALSLAETNIGYTTIKSPVKGTIVDRRVNVGQTVVSSLSVSSLFLIAKDLRQIQVWSSVNEADIGRLKLGMPVRFTVDAFPNDVFHGTIAQIRLNATMTQNVVTYTVVVATDNSDMKLLPYLTADVRFEVEDHKDVLLVPNAALRWQPKPDQVAPDAREAIESGAYSKGGKRGGKSDQAKSDQTKSDQAKSDQTKSDQGTEAGKTDAAKSETTGEQASGATETTTTGGTGRGGRTAKTNNQRTERGALWVKAGDFVRPIEVRVGATDSTNTEVSGAELADGMEVVIGENRDQAAANTVTNPFAPQFFKGGRQGSGQGQGKGQGQGGQGQGGQGQGARGNK